MKKLLCSAILIISAFISNAQSFDSIQQFDLTIVETFGCVVHTEYSINYHFENNEFCIKYKVSNEPEMKRCLTKKDFMVFYDSLNRYKFRDFKKFYKLTRGMSSASGDGYLKIYINKKFVKYISFWTQPDDFTEFMNMHLWFFKNAEYFTSDYVKLIESCIERASKMPVRKD